METLVETKTTMTGLFLTDQKLNPRHDLFKIKLRKTPNLKHHPCEENSQDPPLDTQIWGNLQPELISRILSHLPLTELIHTRLVCKKWDREVYSGRILGHHLASQSGIPFRSWLFLFENGGPGEAHNLKAFDPIRNEWNIFRSAHLPRFATGDWSLCGAASGLMLFKVKGLKGPSSSFSVYNPITTSWKKLPPLIQRRQRPVITMFSGIPARIGHYKVVVAGGRKICGQQLFSTEVYDSRSESWRISCEKMCSNQLEGHVNEEMRASTAFSDGFVYHMRFSRVLTNRGSGDHSLMRYSTKLTEWRILRVPLPPDLVFSEYPSLKLSWKDRTYIADVLPPFLVGSNNRLLLVGFLEDQSTSSISGIAIWKLSGQKKVWKLVTIMPERLFGQMSPKVCVLDYVEPYLQYEVKGVAHGNLVYIYQVKNSGKVFACDLSQNFPTWQCVSAGPTQNTYHAQDLQGCAIDVRLDTLI